MDIKTVFPGEQPTEGDFLWAQNFAAEGFGLFVRDLIGSATVISGLACAPTGPASMTVNVSPGRIYSLQYLRPTAIGQIAGLGGLAADTNADHQIVKQGILRDTTNVGGGGVPFTAPGTAGQSINYLIQAQFVEADSTPTQRVFYNTQNPLVPISSPVSDFRLDQLVLSVKAGTPATTGSQTTPAADTGCVPVWIVTVANGQTSIVSGNITQHPSAPFFSLAYTGSGLASVSGGVVTVTSAPPADVWAGTTLLKAMTPGGEYNALAEQTLTDAATIAVDMSTFINAKVTLGGNRAMGNPTNPKVGQSGFIRLIQDATGSRTLSFGSNWRRQGGAPTLTTTANAVDVLEYQVITSTYILYSVMVNPS